MMVHESKSHMRRLATRVVELQASATFHVCGGGVRAEPGREIGEMNLNRQRMSAFVSCLGALWFGCGGGAGV